MAARPFRDRETHPTAYAVMNCPTCESQTVFPSQSGNAALFFPLRLVLICLRCHCCGRRSSTAAASHGAAKTSYRRDSSPYGSSRAT